LGAAVRVDRMQRSRRDVRLRRYDDGIGDHMGRGDRRTRRGKIWRKSFGKCRPRNPDKPENASTAVAAAPTAPAKKPVKKTTKKAAAS